MTLLHCITGADGASHTTTGGGLSLTVTADERIVLRTLGPGSGVIGSFTDAADAWRALDEIDAPAELDVAA